MKRRFETRSDENDYEVLNSDWSDSVDDMEPHQWEYHMGGPDDDNEEASSMSGVGVDEFLIDNNKTEIDISAHDDDPGADESPQQTSDMRRAAIVAWLADAPITRALRGNRGFYVSRTMHVRLEDGNTYNALEWLFDEDIGDGSLINGYSVSYTPPGGPWAEKLTFFLHRTDAPFMPPEHQPEKRVDDDMWLF